ncbi:hypothetical protein D910_10007 [Dendroctonus ponderosae]
MVSIKCTDDLGIYQGEISDATSTKITLQKAFCDGFPCADGPVQIRAVDIVDIKFIEKPAKDEQENSIVTIAKPVPKRAGRSHSTSEASGSKQSQNGVPSRSKPIEIEPNKKSEDSLNFSYNKNTPIRKGVKGGKQWVKGSKDEECFGAPLDHKIKGEFDFEKNLALFDKQAIWEKLNSSRPDACRFTITLPRILRTKSLFCRHDENVLPNHPTSIRQIIVPLAEIQEYVTDDGLIIPCISRNLRRKLFDFAEKAGLTWDKRVELFGTAAAEIAIQLLGGGHRLNPNNKHQIPTVVVLCGPHKQGAAGINAARQLASHGVRTIVFCPFLEAVAIKKELSLYMLTRNRTISSVPELPATTDLIICALSDDSDSPKSNSLLVEWADKNTAPVLVLDPPPSGTPGLSAKISLVPVLPLSYSSDNGKLYLANLGFPVDIFKEAGIKYRSPFGAKNTIPLHPSE